MPHGNSGLEAEKTVPIAESNEAASLRAVVESCIMSTAKDAILYTAGKGMIMRDPPLTERVLIDGKPVGLFYDSGKILMKSIPAYGSDVVAPTMMGSIGICVDSQFFQAMGFNATFSEPTVDVVFTYDEIKVTMHALTQITQEDTIETFDRYDITIHYSFGKLWSEMRSYIDGIADAPGWLYFADLPEEHQFTILTVSEATHIVSIVDFSDEFDEPLVLAGAIRFDQQELESEFT